MKRRLIIDAGSQTVTVTEGTRTAWRERTSRWVAFYAQVALARLRDHADGWVTEDEVARHLPWNSNARRGSIGKEVSRHLRKTEVRHGALIVDSKLKTRCWRLNLADSAIVFSPSRSVVARWLVSQDVKPLYIVLNTSWLTAVVDSQIAYHQGNGEDAVSYARKAMDDPSLDLRQVRIAGVALIRATALPGASEQIDTAVRDVSGRIAGGRRRSIPEDRLWGTDHLASHHKARVATVMALARPWSDAPDDVRKLELRLGHLQRSTNLSTTGVIRNLLGVLARRRELYAEAQRHLDDAIAISLTINDFFTLGAALFNMAQAMLQDPASDTSTVVCAGKLLELSTEIDKRIAIGKNTAQAEILRARWEVGKGNFATAEELLTVAQAMIRNSGSAYDEGCLFLAKAELTWRRSRAAEQRLGNGLAPVEELLVRAADLLAGSGKPEYVYVEEQLKKFRNGLGLDTVDVMLERHRQRPQRTLNKFKGPSARR